MQFTKYYSLLFSLLCILVSCSSEEYMANNAVTGVLSSVFGLGAILFIICAFAPILIPMFCVCLIAPICGCCVTIFVLACICILLIVLPILVILSPIFILVVILSCKTKNNKPAITNVTGSLSNVPIQVPVNTSYTEAVSLESYAKCMAV